MKYLDCDLTYGYQVKMPGFKRCSTMDELIEQMKNAGLNGGLVHCCDTDKIGVVYGNTRLAQDLKTHADCGMQLLGAWGLVPSVTGETPSPVQLPKIMAENQIAAIYFNPREHQFSVKPNVIGDYCAMAEERRIPVLFDTNMGMSCEAIDEILSAFPKLCARINLNAHWPRGRQIYPILDRYENTWVDLAYRWEDQGIEDMVQRFGAKRLIMGSAFPVHYIGGALAYVRCAEISDEEKELIFGGNLLRIVKEADFS